MSKTSLVYISALLMISMAVCRREAEQQEGIHRQEPGARGTDRAGKEGYICREGH
ncbi:hypothetical protein ACE3MQ_24005 [Paenibacillus lentus]|uniref:hypothetical protein n=1 Tax=Paenibacillus lentus TaxID=1338368 RepID=UPI00364CF5B3